MAGLVLAYLIGAPIVFVLEDIGGWRLAFLGFVLSLSLLSLLLSMKGLPSTSIGSESHFLEGFKLVFSNRSAVSCLFGVVFSFVSQQGLEAYSASFFREKFLIPTGWAALLLLGIAVCAIFGSLLSGKLVNKLGRKRLKVLGTLILGLASIIYVKVPILWLSLIILNLGTISAGIRLTASDSLTLEQVPEFRGTMMSLNTAAIFLGGSIGTAIGGIALLTYGWETLWIILGSFSIVAALIFHFLVTDPTKK